MRLFLSHYPNFLKGSKGQDDHIQLKSSYFEQKVPLTFFLHSRDTPTTASTSGRARSLSPSVRSDSEDGLGRSLLKTRANSANRGRGHGHGHVSSRHEEQELIETLTAVIKGKDEKLRHLEETIGHLEAKYPNWQQIIQNRIDQVCEHKSIPLPSSFPPFLCTRYLTVLITSS